MSHMTDSATASRPPKRERLVESARDLLYEQGVQRTTLAQIAERADVPVGNVYYYYKTRDELVHAVIESRLERMREVLGELDRRSSPKAVTTRPSCAGRPGGSSAGSTSSEDRQARGRPRREAGGEVGGARESELLQRHRREARLIALLAHQDDPPAEVAAQPRVVVARRRIATPLEHVARVEDRARDETAARPLDLGTDVDDERAVADGVEHVTDADAIEPLSRAGKQLIDRGPRYRVVTEHAPAFPRN